MSFQVNEYLSIWVNYFWKFLITFNKNHKKNCKPDSVNSPKRKCLLFICALHCCKALAVYPSVFGASHSYLDASRNPIYLTLHRTEFTWFHYKLIYILSVALVLISRPTDVIRYAALWCPDFPTPKNFGINKPFFLWSAKIGFFVWGFEGLGFEQLDCEWFFGKKFVVKIFFDLNLIYGSRCYKD